LPAAALSFPASRPPMVNGIAILRPKVSVTRSPRIQIRFLRTLTSLQGINDGGCINRKKKIIPKYKPSELAPTVRQLL